MDEIHKKILQRNRSNLVKDLDPSKLYDGLLEKGIFTQDMIDEIQSAGTRRNQARQLVQDLETRGSRAFPLFLQCLQETGQESLAELLQNGAPAVTLQPATPTQVVRPVIQPLPITSPVDGNNPGKDVKKPGIPFISPPGGGELRPGPGRGYKMDASPCGHCLIINNMEFEPHSMLKNRKGSNIDCEKLERRFKTLNFVVEVRTNLRQKQIKHELLTLSKKDHSQYDCCVVIMLSHGTEVNHNRFPGAVYGVDGQYVPVQHITNYLNGQHCPSLQGKPKLFFIQACGGDEKDMGFEVSPDEVEPSSGGVDDQTDAIPMSSSSDSLSMSDEPDARPTLPTPSDILVSYSTFPGYVSWRETQSGSWYVQTLDCILEESAATVDLVTMLMMVNNEVSQNSAKGLYKQMPGSFNFLRKLLYFQTQT
ncbi:caspase-9 isoform X2 [Haplochromis burtoni]|uniref:caspase-9 isoform X2 n=1 Tax=Haplochromis burtoni TaxID=8153 RepID=UPI0003BC9285|nr:caspase-9 isoform X2 [Haplochromis burtoni]